MSIDGSDLERAGTRARRQFSNPKKYSTYPPEDDLSAFPYGRRSSSLLNKRSRPLMFLCLAAIVLFILYLLKSSLSTIPTSPQKLKPKLAFEDSGDFADSTQFTDYALLNDLLSTKKGTPHYSCNVAL